MAPSPSNLLVATWLLQPFKGEKLGWLCQHKPFHLQGNDNPGLAKMRTKPWIKIILPGCLKNMQELLLLPSYSFSSSSLYANLESPEDGLWVRKSILLCLADPSLSLFSMLLISKKAVNLKWASKCSFPTSFQTLKYDIPVGTRGGQRPWIFCVFRKPLSRRGQGQLFPFQNSRQVSKMFIHVNFLKHQNWDYLTS